MGEFRRQYPVETSELNDSPDSADGYRELHKFIERHKGVLTELLDAQLDPSRIDAAAPDFAGRFGFLRKPGYVRFRMDGGFRTFSELSVRADEFTAAPERLSRVYVVENEITYLAFPVPAAAMVIFGAGYAVPVLEPLGWLADRDVVYWGDLDTHGFAILNRLRHRLRHARPHARVVPLLVRIS